MHHQLLSLSSKGVFRFTVRFVPCSSNVRPDPQRIGEKLATGFTNCVKLLYPESYTNYLITLQKSYSVPDRSVQFNKAEDLASSLKQNLPSNLRSAVIKCIQEN